MDGGAVYEKTVRLAVPEYVEGGDYLWMIELGGLHGIVNEMKGDSLATTINEKEIKFIMDPLDCYLEIPNEPQKYTLLEGVDIKSEESVFVKCKVQNFTGEAMKLDVYQTTRYRSSWGDIVSEGVYQNNQIEIGAGSETELSLTISGNQVPQAYDTIFSFKSGNVEVVSPLEVHYVVYGRSATIHNITLDRSAYKLGDDAVIGLAWSGSANNFPGSRFGEIEQELKVSFKLTNSEGVVCGKADNLPLSDVATHSLDKLKMLIINDCDNLILETNIFSADNELLAYSSNNFSGGEYVDLAEESAPTRTEMKISSILIPLVGFLAVIILILWLRKRNKIMNIVASVVLISASLLLGASVYASSFGRNYSIWDVPNQSWSPHPVTITFAGPSGTYTGTSLITFSGSLSNGVCANIATRSRWTVRIYNSAGTQVFSNQSRVGTAPYSNSWRANQFPRSGSYRGVITWEDTGCARILNGTPNPPPDVNDGAQCNTSPTVSESFTFSIIAAPAISLTADPDTIDPGGTSEISWSVSDATGCTAALGWSGAKNRVRGDEDFSPAATTNYRLDCTGPGGSSSRTATITVRPPIVTLVAAPARIGPGDTSTLTWTARGATTCTANSGPWSGVKNRSGGNEIVRPLITSTYGLRCVGPSGTTDRTATVTLPSGSLNASQCPISDNQATCLSTVRWTSQNFLGTRSVRQGSTEFATSANGSASRAINPDNRTFSLRDGGSRFMIEAQGSAVCLNAPDSVWVSAAPACMPLPVIDVESNPNIVRSGNVAPIVVSILANYQLTCTITGGMTETFNHNPSATTFNHSFSTNPLRAAQIVTVNCVSPIYPELFGNADTRIEVVPTVQEI